MYVMKLLSLKEKFESQQQLCGQKLIKNEIVYSAEQISSAWEEAYKLIFSNLQIIQPFTGNILSWMNLNFIKWIKAIQLLIVFTNIGQ